MKRYRLVFRQRNFVIFFLILFFCSLFYNLDIYEFRNEESLRVAIAYEMSYMHKYIQPYFLGEPYYNKPPLFNWLIIFASYLIPWSELTARVVSIFFLLFTLIFLFIFSYRLFKNINQALLSSLIFLTFGNILFFYGYLGEIDTTFTFFVFLSIFLLFLYVESQSLLWSALAGLFVALSFLLKGLPAYSYYGLTLVALSLYKRDLKLLLGKKSLLMHFLAIALPALWLLTTESPLTYLGTLFQESFSRVSNPNFSRILHILTYPFLNFKDTLPGSFFFLVSLFTLYKAKNLDIPKEIKPLILVFLINYLPYLISSSAGRYIMPLYPILAMVFSYYVKRALERKSFKIIFYIIITITLIIKFLVGGIYFPYYSQRESSRKAIAQKIFEFNESAKVDCQCPQEKSVCLYLSLWKRESLKSKDAEYAITCNNQQDALLSFDVKKPYRINLVKLKH